jgi:ElaB/YqjD/DUF883 family membrane-anchored ribosome-binding protein
MSSSTTKSRAVVSRHITHAAKSAEHLNGLAHDAKDTLSRNGTKAIGKIQALSNRIQEGKKAAVNQVKRAAVVVREKAKSVDKTIRAKPYQSLGVAAGAGLVAGYLISRRRSRAS